MDNESKQILKEQLELLKKINRHFIYQRIAGTIKNIMDEVLGSISQFQNLIQSAGF